MFTGLKANETCLLEKTKFIKHDISTEKIDTFKFLLENVKWDKILPDNSPDKAYGIFRFIFCDLNNVHFQKEKLELKPNIYSLPG